MSVISEQRTMSMKKLSIIVIFAAALLAACGGSTSTVPSSTMPTSTTSTTSIATSTTSTTAPTSETISDLLAFLDSRGFPCSNFVQDDSIGTYDPAGYGKGMNSGACKLEGKTNVKFYTFANPGQKVLAVFGPSISCALGSNGERYDWVDGGLWTMDFDGEKSTSTNDFENIAQSLAQKTKAKAWSVVCGQPTLQGTNPEQTP